MKSVLNFFFKVSKKRNFITSVNNFRQQKSPPSNKVVDLISYALQISSTDIRFVFNSVLSRRLSAVPPDDEPSPTTVVLIAIGAPLARASAQEFFSTCSRSSGSPLFPMAGRESSVEHMSESSVEPCPLLRKLLSLSLLLPLFLALISLLS